MGSAATGGSETPDAASDVSETVSETADIFDPEALETGSLEAGALEAAAMEAGALDGLDGVGSEGEADGPLGWRRVHGAIGLVDLEAPPELLAAELGSLRIFAGYAGWGPGQLEDELSEGAWYVVESEPGDVSSPSPEGLWRSVLRRQRSELALVATYPDDPSLN
ncbi:YqgE/AlgH family protein [Streptomyces iconiensis]|uniref:YqgE/AlgH family protein n=1 Tax=Streptomyces iconiensis TaxID=1384038 RepID=UPI003D2F6322